MGDQSTAAQTAGSRLPDPLKLVPELGEVAGLLYKTIGNGTVPQSTISFMHLRAGQIVGNTYLTLMHTESLRKAGESEERITAVSSWQDARCFTEAEAVALALAEAVLQPSAHGERVSDELYARAARCYDDKALVTLILALGQVNFFIPLAVIGRPIAGAKPSEQWS
ncbi:carboxymuconolactone decarboxylase family protein [Streptomyces sp. NPDC005209]|uniref:carboxymuconolactone decarboxylase family protein n=1 Tax=Streptomyces sp. NPDC005209 TaxID=3156715 RepID=UPI0033B0083E